MNRNLLNMKILTGKILERNRDGSCLRRNILYTNGLVEASGKDISVIRDWNVSLKYARVFALVQCVRSLIHGIPLNEDFPSISSWKHINTQFVRSQF